MKSIEVRLVGRFRFERKISGEHAHLLYLGIHTQNDEFVFMKGDEAKKKNFPGKLTILQEGKILQTMQGGIGIPHMHWCGQEEDYNFIVLQNLSHDFKKLMIRCGGKLSLKTSLLFGIEAISILQYYHFKNFLHCGLRPEHFMIGSGSKYTKTFIVDYSSSIRYRDNQTLEHINDDQKDAEERTFNMEFSSINYHSGKTPSRKDDLISLLFLIAYFEKGELPWSRILKTKGSDREKSQQILAMKNELTAKQIFQGCPDLASAYQITKQLKFDEKPRYSYYKNLFRQRLEREGEIEDGVTDWMLIDDEEDLQADNFGLDIEIIPNQAEFLQKLEEQIRVRDKAEAEKLSLTKTVEVKRENPKDKECRLF